MNAEAEKTDDCIDCGRPIGEARRAALPEAIRCVGCQGKIEGKGKRGNVL